MAFQRDVVVPKEEVALAYAFARKIIRRGGSSAQQSTLDFQTPEDRTATDATADTVLGKIAEFAFSRFADANLGFKPLVDLNIYPGVRNHDNGDDIRDIVVNGDNTTSAVKADVKGIRAASSWLLLETFKVQQNNSDYYILVRALDLPGGPEWEREPAAHEFRPWRLRVEGFVHKSSLYIMENGNYVARFEYLRGEKPLKSAAFSLLKNEFYVNDAATFNKRVRAVIQGSNDRMKLNMSLKASNNTAFPLDWLASSDVEWLKFAEAVIGPATAVTVVEPT